jgi:hypothetical protein
MTLSKILCEPTACLTKTAYKWNTDNQASFIKSSVGSRALCIIAVPISLTETTVKGGLNICARIVNAASCGIIDNVRKSSSSNTYYYALCLTVTNVMMGVLSPKNSYRFGKHLEITKKETMPLEERVEPIVVPAVVPAPADPDALAIEPILLPPALSVPVVDGTRYTTLNVSDITKGSYILNLWTSLARIKTNPVLDLRGIKIRICLIPAAILYGLKNLGKEIHQIVSYPVRRDKAEARDKILETHVKVVFSVISFFYGVQEVLFCGSLVFTYHSELILIAPFKA